MALLMCVYWRFNTFNFVVAKIIVYHLYVHKFQSSSHRPLDILLTCTHTIFFSLASAGTSLHKFQLNYSNCNWKWPSLAFTVKLGSLWSTRIKESDHVEFKCAHARSYKCCESMCKHNDAKWSKTSEMSSANNSIETDLVCDHVAECWMSHTTKYSNYILQMIDIRNMFCCAGLDNWSNPMIVFLFIQRRRNVLAQFFFSLFIFSILFATICVCVCAFHCSKVDMFRVLIKWKHLHEIVYTQAHYIQHKQTEWMDSGRNAALRFLMIHFAIQFYMCQI